MSGRGLQMIVDRFAAVANRLVIDHFDCEIGRIGFGTPGQDREKNSALGVLVEALPATVANCPESTSSTNLSNEIVFPDKLQIVCNVVFNPQTNSRLGN
jgi:hypothetical protein